MKKKIVSIFVCMLLFVTVASVTGTEIVDKNEMTSSMSISTITNRAPWDLLFNHDLFAQTGGVSRSGCEFDGTYFYSTVWNSNLVDRYDSSGNIIETFSIAGVSGLRDLAWDGTYMYGGAAAGTIWEMDFTNKVLISSISGGFQSRAIAYNDDDDTFYCSNFADPAWEVDRTGAIVNTWSFVTTTSTYGFAYDSLSSPGQLYLWVFDQGGGGGSPQLIHQWDLTAGAFTGFTYDVQQDIGSGTGIAGGLFLTTEYDPSIAVIGGIYQDGDSTLNTDWLFGYELCSLNSPPDIPSTPSGEDEGITGVEYTFTTSTTDPEGEDVYYWFDWGDGTDSGWVGPYGSGDTGSASHAWDEAGDFDVKVKAKDVNDIESDWSGVHTITIVSGPLIDIGAVTGGLFKVNAKIRNEGAVAATGVQWSINLVGGAFIGKETSGTDDIPASGEITATSSLIIGFGATVVTVTAEIPEMSDTKELDGFVFLFFIKVNPGGGL